MFDQLVDGACAALWNLAPSQAVYLGKHEYDGTVPELTEDAIEAQLDRLEALRERLGALEGLDREQQLDRAQLGTAVDSALIEWGDRALWRTNPMTPVGPLDVTLYLARDYAPFSHRAEQAAAVLDQAPRILDQARECLEGTVPTVFAEWAVRQAEGMAVALESDIPAQLPDDDPFAAGAVVGAGETAAGALRDYAAWIRTELLPGSNDEFAVGGEVLESMVQRGELLEIGLDRLLEAGEEDLAANLEAAAEAAALIEPGTPVSDVYSAHVATVHAPRDGLVAEAREMLETIRRFLVERDLISIPSEVRALVAETPRHMRWALAMMSTPGPYETEATEAYYYVTPPEPDWGDEETESLLRVLNTFTLEDISVHEAYPGHYVHFLHAAAAPTEVSRRVNSYAFAEGWAHYVEQMMWEEGYRDGDPRFRMAQLGEALVRNCRLVASIRMHAHGMTLDEAAALFVENAFYDPASARVEAERGAFDPGYYSYTLGKLEMLKHRGEQQARLGSGFELKAFHDAMLGRGSPPLGLIGELLGGSRLAD